MVFDVAGAVGATVDAAVDVDDVAALFEVVVDGALEFFLFGLIGTFASFRDDEVSLAVQGLFLSSNLLMSKRNVELWMNLFLCWLVNVVESSLGVGDFNLL